MSLVMQQKASVGRFDVYFGLDLYRFVKELCAKKRKHSICLYFRSELNQRVALAKTKVAMYSQTQFVRKFFNHF